MGKVWIQPSMDFWKRPGPCCECGKSFGKWFQHKKKVYCLDCWPYAGLADVYRQEVSRKRRVEEKE